MARQQNNKTPAVALAATGGPTAAAAVGPFGFGCGRKRPQPSNMREVNTPNSLRGKRMGKCGFGRSAANGHQNACGKLYK